MQVAERINDECAKHGIDLRHGPCGAKRGALIHSWDKHGVSVKEFGEGASQAGPDHPAFTVLDETVHMDYHGACVSFTSTAARIDALRQAASAHGKHLARGHCAERPVRCENSHGYKICASHEGVDTSDIIEMDIAHAWHNGRCYSAEGSHAEISELRHAAAAHGIKTEDGGCHQNDMECREWRGLHVCRSGPRGSWGGEEDVHAVKDGHCLQLHGAAIRDGQVDAAIARKLAARGAKLQEGGCRAAGFTDRVWHRSAHGVSVSVWTH